MTMLTREAQISTDRIYCCKEKYSFRINCHCSFFNEISKSTFFVTKNIITIAYWTLWHCNVLLKHLKIWSHGRRVGQRRAKPAGVEVMKKYLTKVLCNIMAMRSILFRNLSYSLTAWRIFISLMSQRANFFYLLHSKSEIDPSVHTKDKQSCF